MSLIIGICGERQHGKDTVAAILMDLAAENSKDAVRVGMGDALKQEIAECFAPKLAMSVEDIVRQMHTTGEKERWRLIMQWWGTEFRRTEDKDYWVNKLNSWVKMADCNIILIADTRHMNEMAYIVRKGGVLVRVNRPAMSVTDTHSSEHEWKQFTGWFTTIENDSDFDSLRVKVKELYNTLEARGYIQ